MKWPRLRQLLAAAVGSFCGIAVTAYFSFIYHAALLVPSFGASAVLLYAAPHLPMAKPKKAVENPDFINSLSWGFFPSFFYAI